MDFAVSSDIICELLEVTIHLILYTREIYPQSVFQRRRKFNIPVQMCVHPALSSYISECVGSIRPILEKGEVEKVFVVILSPSGCPVERFVFELTQTSVKPQEIRHDPNLVQLEESLRAFCLKLSISDSLLQPLPLNCSFAVQLQVPRTTQTAMSSTNNPQTFPWIEAEDSQTAIRNAHLVPLKSLRSELCSMQLYVEESVEKRPDVKDS